MKTLLFVVITGLLLSACDPQGPKPKTDLPTTERSPS